MECQYITHGNLCANDKFCEDKAVFVRPVTIDKKLVYGVCEEAPTF